MNQSNKSLHDGGEVIQNTNEIYLVPASHEQTASRLHKNIYEAPVFFR